MNDNYSVEIKLNEFNKIKEFASVVCSFESDINIERGRIIYDAKSIMALFALGTYKPIKVTIIPINEKERISFINEMEYFKNEEGD